MPENRPSAILAVTRSDALENEGITGAPLDMVERLQLWQRASITSTRRSAEYDEWKKAS
jgi:hypothetical protein